MPAMEDVQAIDSVIVACPTDGVLNRVPCGQLGQAPNCGRCGQPLFQGKPVTLNAKSFDQHVLRSTLPVLVDFWAPWCGPCVQMAPYFAAAAPQLEPGVRLAKLDTQAHPEPAARYGIQGIPTMILFGMGREVARISGAMPTREIVGWTEQALRGA